MVRIIFIQHYRNIIFFLIIFRVPERENSLIFHLVMMSLGGGGGGGGVGVGGGRAFTLKPGYTDVAYPPLILRRQITPDEETGLECRNVGSCECNSTGLSI